MINLGCPKNTVDAECLLGMLVTEGFLIAENPADADLCLVNTCGFIDCAREESLKTLERIARQKRSGRPRKIIALGCMVERVRDWTRNPLSEWADEQVGFSQYARLPDLCRAALGMAQTPERKRTEPYLRLLDRPRLRVGLEAVAYLKIAEGCSNACAYCSIPLIRGPLRSRPIGRIVREAETLIAHGARELNIIAQDVTAYGIDRYRKPRLVDLLRRLLALDHDAWIRLLYAYPQRMTDELLETLAADPRCCPYIDMPLQHLSERVLRRMRRPATAGTCMRAVERVRARLPNGSLRTTFLVGFPGETGRDVETLVKTVREGWFDHVGVFAYSPEPGTAAEAMGDPIPAEEKQARRAHVMEAQQAVSAARLRERIGGIETVLVERIRPGIDERPVDVVASGRTQRESPGVDGVVYLRGEAARGVTPGDRVPAQMVHASAYDLLAEPCASFNAVPNG